MPFTSHGVRLVRRACILPVRLAAFGANTGEIGRGRVYGFSYLTRFLSFRNRPIKKSGGGALSCCHNKGMHGNQNSILCRARTLGKQFVKGQGSQSVAIVHLAPRVAAPVSNNPFRTCPLRPNATNERTVQSSTDAFPRMFNVHLKILLYALEMHEEEMPRESSR